MAGRDVAPGVRGSIGASDPEIHAADEAFRRVLDGYLPVIKVSRVTGRRVMYADAVGVKGEIEFTGGASPHPFFAGTYPVLARFSNSASSDDAAPDVRGLSLMLLDPADQAASPFNLTMSTGRLMFVPDAVSYSRYMLGGDEAQEELARRFPGMAEALWESVREPVSYAAYHYYSKVPRLHVTDEGPALVRYRVVPSEHAVDAGFHDPHGRRFPPVPPNSLERDPADDRPPSLLWNDVRSRIAEGGFTMLLQAQRHPLGDDPGANQAALDASRDWPDHRYPYRTLATVRFDGLLDGITAEQLLFDPAVAPDGLGIALARTPDDTASINHLRALVYGPAHAARTGLTGISGRPRRTPVTVREPRGDAAPRRRTVCVVGAGASGLTAARELERLGHRAVVLESAAEVAGKAASTRVDGRVYDLGAHICTTRYTELLSLACELGVETQATTPMFVYDTAKRHVEPVPLPTPEVIGRYHHLREEYFPRIARPGLAHSAAVLARPASHLLCEFGLTGLATALGTGYTSCGYGSLEEVPALYFLKFAEYTGLVPLNRSLRRRSGTFTIKGGFARLWRRVAEELSDVRLGVRIESIERGPDGVTVHVAGSGPVEADDLLLTVPLDRVIHLLSPTDLERDVASRIRTLDFRTMLCRISGLPRQGFYMFPGPAEGLVAYHSRHADQDVCTCYCYGAAGMAEDALAVLVAESVEQIGGHVDEVLQVEPWPFMPHFGTADLASGILDRIERSQGTEHTYHVGSLLAYELIETDIAYARDLVRRYFTPHERPPHTDDPSPQELVTDGSEYITTVTRDLQESRLTEDTEPEDDARVTHTECASRDLGTGLTGTVDGRDTGTVDGRDTAEAPVTPAAAPIRKPLHLPPVAVPVHRAADEISAWLVSHVAERLGRPEQEVDPRRPIDEHGLDSLAMAELHTELTTYLGRPVPLATLYRLPTLEALARYLEGAVR